MTPENLNSKKYISFVHGTESRSQDPNGSVMVPNDDSKQLLFVPSYLSLFLGPSTPKGALRAQGF